jgi:hypothetical protein
MAEANDVKNGKEGSSKTLFWVLFLLVVGLAAGASFLYKEAGKARASLEDSKREYEDMQKLKRTVAEGLSRVKRQPSAKDAGEDMLVFLDKKRAQAGIPQNIFRPQRNAPTTQGGWVENSYTITMMGTKEAPVQRSAVADFMLAVESDRPAIKSRNLTLNFVPSSNDLTSVSITFSQFQRQ